VYWIESWQIHGRGLLCLRSDIQGQILMTMKADFVWVVTMMVGHDCATLTAILPLASS